MVTAVRIGSDAGRLRRGPGVSARATCASGGRSSLARSAPSAAPSRTPRGSTPAGWSRRPASKECAGAAPKYPPSTPTSWSTWETRPPRTCSRLMSLMRQGVRTDERDSSWSPKSSCSGAAFPWESPGGPALRSGRRSMDKRVRERRRLVNRERGRRRAGLIFLCVLVVVGRGPLPVAAVLRRLRREAGHRPPSPSTSPRSRSPRRRPPPGA